MQNSEYLKRTKYSKSKVTGIYVDGSAARQLEESTQQRMRREAEERARRRRKAEAQAKRNRAAERQASLIRAVVAMAVAAVVMFLALSVLNGSVKTNALSDRISELEGEYNTLVSQNDSKEYDINRSVDLNKIIKTAEEYGMTRGGVDQIITYRADDSEYIQQIASLPER